MNFIKQTLVVGFLLCSILIMESCKNEVLPSEKDPPNINGNPGEFSMDLFKAEVFLASDGENVVISPLSVDQVLRMILSGATGETADEIEDAYGNDVSTADLLKINKEFMEWLDNRNESSVLSVNNAVFYDDASIELLSTYKTNLVDNFDAGFRKLDFSDQTVALKAINDWVNDKTEGRIPKVLNQIASNEVIFLVNALYMKADWKDGFVEEMSRDANFTLENGSVVTTEFMSSDRGVKYVTKHDMDMIELPYKDDEMSMFFIKPTEGKIDEMISNLSQDKFSEMIDEMENKRYQLTIPKFTLDYENKAMQQSLKEMGVNKAFTEQAELTEISERKDLYVTRVIHKTFLSIDEKGTEGAAVTAGGIGITSVPPALSFDSPFVIIIKENTTDNILFIGRISDPR